MIRNQIGKKLSDFLSLICKGLHSVKMANISIWAPAAECITEIEIQGINNQQDHFLKYRPLISKIGRGINSSKRKEKEK